ncbi:hypothetical protein [Aquibacillus sediminis]|uniref:hypothetical protein n=1 Tax=Aquibacillus sediminis TaxID=2574734 RepID=UPI0011097DE1|nr:hypothetical protein [Aquibacillus sediminis]
MDLQPPLKDRVITSIGYALPIFLSGPLLSIDAVLTVGAVLVYYFILRKQSRFFFHHVRQNVNVVLSYYLYRGIINLFIFLVERVLSMGGEGLQEWIAEQVFLQPLFFFLGVLSPIFFTLLLQSVFHIALGLLIIFVLMGKWTRIPLVIRFIKTEMHEL